MSTAPDRHPLRPGRDRGRPDRAGDPHLARLRRHARAAVPRPHRPRPVRPVDRARPTARDDPSTAGTPPTAARSASSAATRRRPAVRSAAASTPCAPDRIVQTFTWEGMPDDVALETLTFEDLGDGRTRLHAPSLCDSFEARDAWLRSGMEIGVNDGYAAIDRMLADGTL